MGETHMKKEEWNEDWGWEGGILSLRENPCFIHSSTLKNLIMVCIADIQRFGEAK